MRNLLDKQQKFSMADLETVFMQFSPQDIEEFYQLYQLWSLKKKRAQVIAKLNELDQQLLINRAHSEAAKLSPIALATLSQFRAVGVDDIDLLDRMLERGDEWLDHTLQLFEYCERFDMLEGNTTEWCRHALEGAYDWIESMGNINEQSTSNDNPLLAISATSTNQSSPEIELLPTTTEADFLQKLQSEEGDNTEFADKIPETLQYSAPTEDQTQHLQPTETDNLPDTQQYSTPTEDQTQHLQPTETDNLPDTQQYSTPTEDQAQDLQPTETDNTPEQINPLAQPTSAPQPTPNADPKGASQMRKSHKISRKTWKGSYKIQGFNQYKRKQKRSR